MKLYMTMWGMFQCTYHVRVCVYVAVFESVCVSLYHNNYAHRAQLILKSAREQGVEIGNYTQHIGIDASSQRNHKILYTYMCEGMCVFVCRYSICVNITSCARST